MKSYDIVVVGGGVCGLWSAYFLAKCGRRVVIIERDRLCGGSSGRSAGIVTTQLSLLEDILLVRRSIDHYLELSYSLEEQHLKFFEKTGFVSVEPEWMAEYSVGRLKEVGVESEVLSDKEASSLVEGFKVLEGEVAVYTHNDGLLDAGSMAEVMRRELSELGVDVFEDANVKRVVSEDASISSLLIDGRSEELRVEEAVVAAAGPWNKKFLSGLGVRLPTVTYKCSALLLTKPSGNSPRPCYFSDSHLYLRPEGVSKLIAGNGYAKVVESPDEVSSAVESEFVEALVEKLLARALKPDEVRVSGGWSGVCSSTPDGLPLLGKVPQLENLFVIDGLDGYGLMRAPALAEGLTCLIAGQSFSLVDLSKFDPARFASASKWEEKVIELHS